MSERTVINAQFLSLSLDKWVQWLSNRYSHFVTPNADTKFGERDDYRSMSFSRFCLVVKSLTASILGALSVPVSTALRGLLSAGTFGYYCRFLADTAILIYKYITCQYRIQVMYILEFKVR
ncbi:MAG: hypothetical protein HC862_16155 [Scytonema sp. RU_4_4]|nr:hypothetical protein [Scytonema sp. RU_4_4]NJR72543.1 hypothetical protein [Scytonema sp. CRU_2_7]